MTQQKTWASTTISRALAYWAMESKDEWFHGEYLIFNAFFLQFDIGSGENVGFEYELHKKYFWKRHWQYP